AASSIAHMGFILIGTYAGTATALQGVVMLVVAHALSSAGLFIMSGQIHERLHTREMPQMGGLFGRAGALSGFGLALLMATLGISGSANFIGAFLLLFGGFPAFPCVIALATVGLILAAIYSLALSHRVYWGPPQTDQYFAVLDAREYITLASMLV